MFDGACRSTCLQLLVSDRLEEIYLMQHFLVSFRNPDPLPFIRNAYLGKEKVALDPIRGRLGERRLDTDINIVRVTFEL